MSSQADHLVAGVDVATQEVRAMCVDGAGNVHGSGSASLPPPTRPHPGWSEQDASAWWPAVGAALREATGALGTGRGRIGAVSVSATSGTVLLVGPDGDPLGPSLMYDDRRATNEAENAQEAGRARWDSLGLEVTESFGLPKLAWMLAHSEVTQVWHAWHASDFVVAQLTGGPPPTDWSHALKSGYDPVRLEWPAEVLDALDIPDRLVPEVLAPSSPAGRVSQAAAERTGLPLGCEVRLGMTDSCASQIASGADRPGRFVSVLGTTLVIKGATRALLKDPSGALYSHRHTGGWWLPGGASNTGGAALSEWFGDRDWPALDEEAAERGPAQCITYPLTRDGERFPFHEPRARHFTLGTPADEVERYRAVLEGVAFLERLAYCHLSALGATIIPPIAVAGGGSRSNLWNRIRASVLDTPVMLPATPETAFGACMLAAAGTLHQDLEAASESMVKQRKQIEPLSSEQPPMQASYERYVAALDERGWIGGDLRAAASRPPGELWGGPSPSASTEEPP